MIRTIIVPVAAFAVTATAASAFNPSILKQLEEDLSAEQVTAITEAHELHRDGDAEAAREVLENAGVTDEIMDELRELGRKQHEAVLSSIKTKDYVAFKEAVTEGPLAEVITTEEDFHKLSTAHELMEEGDRDGAKEIFDELGLEHGFAFGKHGAPHQRGGAGERMNCDQ